MTERPGGPGAHQFRHALDLTREIFLRIDPAGRIVEANAAAVAAYGYARAELLRLDIAALRAPESRATLERDWRTSLDPGGVAFETIHVRQDGSTFPVEVVSGTTLIDGVLYRESFIRDITERRSAEDARRESDARYRAIADSATDAIVTAGDNGIITAWNAAAERMFGYRASEAVGRPVSMVVPSGSVDAHERGMAGLRASPDRRITGRLIEVSASHRDGSELPVELSLFEWQSPGGHYATAIIRDTTQRRAAQAALERSQAELAEAQRIAHVGSWTWDPASDTVGWSDEMFRIFGLELGIAAPPFAEQWRFYGAATTARIQELVDRSLATGEPWTIEYDITRPDGSVRHLRSDVEAVRNPAGTVVGFRGTAADLTERKRTEDELQRRNVFVESILENAPIGFAVNTIDDGSSVFVSRRFAQIYGLPADSFGTRDDFFVRVYRDPVVREQMRARILADIATGDPARMRWDDVPILTQAGEHRFISASNIPLPDQNLMISTVQDVTERKRAETERETLQAQLNQAQKMESVGRLAGGVAHDFNNMLGVILGHAELAIGQVEPGSPLRSDLEEIRTAATRSADLTRQLLAFARKQPVTPRALDLNEAVGGMVRMMQRLIGERISLAWLPGHGVSPVLVDPSQLNQILTNLCANARDAIADVGRITISTRNASVEVDDGAGGPRVAPGDYVMLAVSDDGCGIDRDTLAHVFEPFFTTKGLGQGTGLGLAMVHGIVEQNGGFIDVRSEVGVGTTFRIYLPRHAETLVQVAADPAQVAPRAGGGETILVVEDEPALLRMSTTMLARLGYGVVAAATPADAIQKAREHGRDIRLLLTDVILPEMNGHALASRLRDLQPGLRCLFMSGYPDDVIGQHGVLDGSVHFIQKPFSLAALGTALREALDDA